MAEEKITTLKLNKGQVWLVTKAMMILTSEEQLQKMAVEFPNADWDQLGVEVDGIIDQLAEGQEHVEQRQPS